MPKISLIKPLDQPLGTRRLLGDLRTFLSNVGFDDLRIIVAYAKSGPIYRLQSDLRSWRAAGKTSEVIFGIDQNGTSREALELALGLFDRVYITKHEGITFHPKIYFIKGQNEAQAFIGSNNLTVGGTEKNFEAGVHLEMTLPADATDLAEVEAAWSQLLPAVCPVTTELTPAELARLVSEGLVIDERAMRRTGATGDGSRVGTRSRTAANGFAVVPESPLPPEVLGSAGRRPARSGAGAPPSPSRSGAARAMVPATSPRSPAVARGLAIQIRPHHNGEIFLSVSAALQNPAFFNWPFNGLTTPKKAGNPAYPQMIPDPVVNITVFGAGSTPVLTLAGYSLNTIYYEEKSEIRVTASPLVAVVPEYSVMIMEKSFSPGVDYEITIHRPDSPDIRDWVSACNQLMPGGGKTPRKFGWF